MEQAVLSANIDKADKIGFEELCASLGMSVSQAVSMFVKNVLNDGELPFAEKDDPFYSEENMERLRKSIAAAEAGQYSYHDIIEVV